MDKHKSHQLKDISKNENLNAHKLLKFARQAQRRHDKFLASEEAMKEAERAYTMMMQIQKEIEKAYKNLSK